MSNLARHFYEFGPFRMDREERMLLRDHQPLTLTPKAFDLLLVLVEHHGHVVEKEELMDTVWPETVVEESNLTHHISALRKALGKGENGQDFIETVPRRGYRFVAEVEDLNGADVVPAALPLSAPAEAAPLPGLRQRPEVLLIAFGFLALTLISAGLYWRFQPGPRAEVEQLEFKGNFYLGRWTEDEMRKGIESYNQAIALDPNSASAYRGLAAGWTFLSDVYLPPREAMPKAKAATLRVIELDKTFASAHFSLGLIKTQYEWDWVGAEQEFKRGFALDPDNSEGHQVYGWYLIALGRFDEAQAEMKRALGADPLNDFGLWGLGDSFYFARQYEQAIEQYRRAIGVQPKLYWAHLMLGCVYGQQGKFTEASAELNQAYRLNDSPQVLAALGHAYATSGQHAEAQKVLAELQETAKRRYVSPYDIATIYAGLGEKEQALAQLEKAYEDRSGWLALWLKVDPKFDGLRADDRFRDLLRRVGHTP